MNVREFIQSNCNRPGEPYLEFVIIGLSSHTVIGSYMRWKSTPDHLQELPEALGGYEIVSWHLCPDPQDCDAVMVRITVSDIIAD